ncbi:MAG: hypothetical protein R3E83_02200 [Burkholderiaceae bacterium]
MNQTGQAIEAIAILMAVYLTISLLIALFMNWYNGRACAWSSDERRSKQSGRAFPAHAGRACTPVRGRGIVGWMRANLFGSVANTVITIVVLALLVWLIPGLVSWLITDAVWGRSRSRLVMPPGGRAPRAVVAEKFRVMTFGTYPFDEQWRGGLVVIILSLLLILSALKWFWN